MMARFQRQRRRLYERPDDYEAVRLALREAAVDHLAERPITALSGGERQRVFIARALAQDTPILLMDEPTSHLDLRHQIAVFELLRHTSAGQDDIVLVSHDLNLTRRYADRVCSRRRAAHSGRGSADRCFSRRCPRVLRRRDRPGGQSAWGVPDSASKS